MLNPTVTPLPPELLRTIDPICDAFEVAWKQGRRVPIEDHLHSVAEVVRPMLLEELICIELEWRCRFGEQPTAAEYCERFPACTEAITDWLAEARTAAVQLPSSAPVAAHGPPTTLQETQPLHDATTAEGGPGALVQVPGFEIVGELGRGGMGVVFKARQLSLGRVVALKMILHAEYAGPEERARFQIEAQAVARLQHPHVVAIHDVGEHGRLPYMAMEFCAGGSLADKLTRGPVPAAETAQLVGQLARAVAAAHRAGVIHRDLKPANVLLTGDGTPKITDFGLAKLTDAEGRTLSGCALGTPSYMAPEQAAGKKDIGPAADVYALGALLYELLTGRPPFKAGTPLETLWEVRTSKVVPPSRLQRVVPAGLEVICLCCLEKEPGRRYGSADALAEDLDRFLAGKKPLAREGPGSGWWRGWRAGRRLDQNAKLLQSRRASRRARRVGVVGLALGIALLAVLVPLLRHGPQPGQVSAPDGPSPPDEQQFFALHRELVPASAHAVATKGDKGEKSLSITAPVASLWEKPSAKIASEKAELPSLDLALMKHASQILKDLWQKTNHPDNRLHLGVLKFLVQTKNNPPSDNAGPLNLWLPSRLEAALVLSLPPNEEKVRILQNASAAVVNHSNRRANHLTEAGRRAFFGANLLYPCCWGTKDVPADAFLIGLVQIDPQTERATVQVQAFDSTGRIQEICDFEAAAGPRTLTEAGISFVVPPTLSNQETKTLQDSAHLSAADLERTPAVALATRPLLDGAPIEFDILYNGKRVEPDEKGLVAEPGEEDKVSFRLKHRGRDKITYGVVLRVNGRNTIFPGAREPDDFRSFKYIVGPGADVLIEGFQEDDDTRRSFGVRAIAQNERDALNYGPPVGLFTVVIFRARAEGEPADSRALPTAAERCVARGLMSLPIKPNSLAALQAELSEAEAPYKAASRGLIVKGEEKQSLKVIEFSPKEAPSYVFNIRCSKP
jgi:serine/threonine protein kinase